MRKTVGRRSPLLLVAAALFAVLLPSVASGDTILDLVPNTAVLLSKTVSSGSGGNGGNTSSASSASNIFAPASYVDYHELGGEPTTVVDHYAFGPGSEPSCAGFDVNGNPLGTTAECQREAACANSASSCTHDLVYVSNPLGIAFPGFSEFYKSSDGGTTFRVPSHNPFFTEPNGTEASGGGDSHQAVGQTTHSIFFVDLSGGCVTMNISRDLGETFSSNKLGCEANPGAIDDREWTAADETGGLQNVYMTVNNDTGCLLVSSPGCAIVFVKSTDDGGANTPADFAAAPCNDATSFSFPGLATLAPSACPDPTDPNFYIAGSIVADTSSTSLHQHSLYIPFARNVGGDFQMWVAISRDQGNSWTRQLVADLGAHDPANIFPNLAIDTAGDLYYTWSQTQRTASDSANEGETDVYYTFSTNGGTTWASPIDLTGEANDSAVFPWMIAGSPGQVDLVLYKANTGLNPNIAFYDSNGNACDPSSQTGCQPNTTVWNAYFGQSQNALNTGANFKLVQISDHPIHTGGICTAGIDCQSSAQQNRDLLDFLTIDIDHTGAAYTTWASDNDSRHDTRQLFTRQLSGNSIIKGQTIAAMNAYPITDHAVTDPTGDVFDATGAPAANCPAMDVVGTSATRSGDLLTVTMTLNAPPTFVAAATCSKASATGGLWGAEFWAASNPVRNTAVFNNDNFYIAYRDNPADGGTGVEAGAINSISPTFTHDEFNKYEDGAPATASGTCFAALPPTPCTVVMTASLTGLGVKSGSILSGVSGFSVYYFGSQQQPPGLRIPLGTSNLADAATPFDMNGTGTTP